MQNTLKQLLVECLRDGHDDKVEMDPLKYPSQILSLAEAILVNIKIIIAQFGFFIGFGKQNQNTSILLSQ